MSYAIEGSLQDVFDRVVDGLCAQGWRRSVEPVRPGALVPECSYRGPGGLKCPVGHLIPDHVYDPSYEGESVEGLVGRGVLSVRGELLEFLMDLQGAHDGAAGGGLLGAIVEVGVLWGLDVSRVGAAHEDVVLGLVDLYSGRAL